MSWKTKFKLKESEYSNIIEVNPEMEKLDGVVYWIRTPEMNKIYSEGYIGITNNFRKRMSSHASPKNGCLILKKAIDKYSWDNLIKEVIYSGTKSDCLKIENVLRKETSVGWNISVGGSIFPILSKEGYEDRSKKAAKTLRAKGYYDSDKASERGKKGSETRRANGFYDSDKVRERNLKAAKTLRANGHYDSYKASKRTIKGSKKRSKTMKSKNTLYNQEVFKLPKINPREKDFKPIEGVLEVFPNFWGAAESIGLGNDPGDIKKVVLNSTGTKNCKGFHWKLRKDLTTKELESLKNLPNYKI